ncbi:MAG: carboxypeptidase regulatory-like domain-containing protein [Armatimonadetes bacterium]|nr:carboxypeptidase regulatory-like domain-containing protein [Armatimonadota bacterium]
MGSLARSACVVTSSLLFAQAVCMAPPVMVTGQAFRSDGKTPWAGAKVGLFAVRVRPDDRSALPAAVAETHTDRHGRFSLGAPKPGPWWIQVREADEPVVHRTIRIEASDGAAPLRVVQGTCRIDGRVTWRPGGPSVAGAELDVRNTWPTELLEPSDGDWCCDETVRHIGADGRFSFDGLEPGDYPAVFEAPVVAPFGTVAQPYWKLTAEGQRLTCEVALQGFTIEGTVLGADGLPAAQASVVLIATMEQFVGIAPTPADARGDAVPADRQRSIRTDGQGRFSLPPVGEGSYRLRAADLAGASWRGRLEVAGDVVSPLNIRLLSNALEGRVLEPDANTPVAGVQISLEELSTSSQEALRWEMEPGVLALTDAGGRFRVPALRPGRYRVKVSVDTGWLLKAPVEVAADGISRVEVALPAGTLDGAIVRPDGSPAKGARARLMGPSERDATAGPDGRFHLPWMTVGPYRVWVREGQHTRYGSLQVGPATTAGVRLVMPAFDPKLVLRLVRPDGRPAAKANVSGTANGTTDAEGRIEQRVPPPAWDDTQVRAAVSLLVSGVGGAGPDWVTYRADRPRTEQTLRLTAGGAIEGTVRATGSGQPLGGVLLTPFRRTGDAKLDEAWEQLYGNWHYRFYWLYPAQFSRDGDGQFRITGLPPGNYMLATRLGQAHGESLVSVAPEGPTQVELTAAEPPRTGIVRGRVLRRGRPLARTEVALWFGSCWPWPMCPDPWGRRVVTDRDGGFSLPVYERGGWRVNVAATLRRDWQVTGPLADLDQEEVELPPLELTQDTAPRPPPVRTRRSSRPGAPSAGPRR